ncbi:MAG: hypothetical protein IKX15_02000, partial [Spirochaetales bacterium]|nr:hypothetical protein [Spirochaetales bacterium]
YTVLSVLIGFLTGIYMPMGEMTKGMQTIGSMMPATHVAALMRQALSLESFGKIMVNAPQETIDDLRFEMGYDLKLFGIEFSPAMNVIYIIAVTAAFFGLAVFLNRRR